MKLVTSFLRLLSSVETKESFWLKVSEAYSTVPCRQRNCWFDTEDDERMLENLLLVLTYCFSGLFNMCYLPLKSDTAERYYPRYFRRNNISKSFLRYAISILLAEGSSMPTQPLSQAGARGKLTASSSACTRSFICHRAFLPSRYFDRRK